MVLNNHVMTATTLMTCFQVYYFSAPEAPAGKELPIPLVGKQKSLQLIHPFFSIYGLKHNNIYTHIFIAFKQILLEKNRVLNSFLNILYMV